MATRAKLANAAAITKILTELKEIGEDGISVASLVAVTGLQDRTVQKWLNLWRRHRFIRVCEYRRHPKGGRCSRIYCLNLNDKDDISPPKNQGTRVYSDIYRKRKLHREALYGIRKL